MSLARDAIDTISFSGYRSAVSFPPNTQPVSILMVRFNHSGSTIGVWPYTTVAAPDRYSFAPSLMGASAAPVLAAIAVFALVQNTKNSGNGVLLKI